MSESRLKKSYQNARVNVFFYLVTLFISFFSRKIFLEKLGADFVGLTGTMQNLLGFLNLAELGIGASIGYVLYKPIFDGNRDKIKEIISVLGYLYRNVGLLILGAGLLLACFLPYIFAGAGIHFGVIYFAYFAFFGFRPHRLFRQLPADPAWRRPAQLCGHRLLPNGQYRQDTPANGVGVPCGQLLPVDSHRADIRHSVLVHPELEDKSGISVAEVRGGGRQAEVSGE